MSSLSVSLPEKISDIQFVGDLMNLFERRKVKCGGAESLDDFASELDSNRALRSDLFSLCMAISHMAAEDLSGEELLLLIARALGGARDANGASEIPDSMRSSFLEGYAAWGNRGAPAMAAPLEWPRERNAPVLEDTPPEANFGNQTAAVEAAEEGGRSFKSALNIAMERMQNDLFLARGAILEAAPLRVAVLGAEEAEVSSGQAATLPELKGGNQRVGKAAVAAAEGVMVIAVVLGGAYAYRSTHRHGHAQAMVSAPLAANRQAPRVVTVATVASAAAPQALARPTVPSRMAATHPTSVAARPSAATGASMPIVEYAPPAPKQLQLADRTAGISGTVMLEVSVSNLGRVSGVRVISGPPELRSRAVETVSRWRFKPALVDGIPTGQTTTVGIFLKGD
jgi:TonB family protein